MDFNIHSIPFLFTSVTFFLLSFFVFLKNKKSSLAKNFLILGVFGFLWYFPYFLLYNVVSENFILIRMLQKLAYIGLIFISPSLYQFILSFLNLRKQTLLKIFYLVSFIFLILVIFTDKIVLGIEKVKYGYLTIPGKYYAIFLGIWILPLLLCLKELFVAYKRSKLAFERRKIKFLLISLFIAYLSFIDTFAIYSKKIYPLGFLPLIVSVIFVSVWVLRYKLFDSTTVEKISLAIFSFIVSIGFIYSISLYVQPYVMKLTGKNIWLFLPIILSFILGFFSLRFIKFLNKLQSEEFSIKDIHRPILKKEAERLVSAKDPYQLATYIIRDLSSLLHLDYLSIFIFDPQKNEFILAKSFNRIKDVNISNTKFLEYKNPIVQLLLKLKTPIVADKLSGIFTIKNNFESKELLFFALKEIRKMGLQIVIPGFCEEQLLAILFISEGPNKTKKVDQHDCDVLFSIANNVARVVHTFLLKQEKIRLIVASQKIIIAAIEAKDNYTRAHTERVAYYSNLIAERIKELSDEIFVDLDGLNWSAQLHDVGKISIPDNILSKSTLLNNQEWEKIRQHPLVGIKLIEPVKDWLGEDICAGIMQHHENYDGSGYPLGKKGKEIHIFARIIRVADAFDAMTTDRPYRAAFTRKSAIDELTKYKSIYFDPTIVEILEKLYYEGKI